MAVRLTGVAEKRMAVRDPAVEMGHRATGEGDRRRGYSRSQCFLRAKTTVSDRGLLSP